MQELACTISQLMYSFCLSRQYIIHSSCYLIFKRCLLVFYISIWLIMNWQLSRVKSSCDLSFYSSTKIICNIIIKKSVLICFKLWIAMSYNSKYSKAFTTKIPKMDNNCNNITPLNQIQQYSAHYMVQYNVLL